MSLDTDAFLQRCSDTERQAFRAIIEALDPVVRELNADTLGPDRPGLRWVLQPVCLMVQLHVPARAGKSDRQGALLYIWPSNADRTKKLWDSISMSTQDLSDANVSAAAIEAFGRDLEKADFARKDTEGWRTRTFREARPDRLSSIFLESWGQKNLAHLVTAVRNVVANAGA